MGFLNKLWWKKLDGKCLKDENLELKRALQQSTLALDAVLHAREEGTRNPEGLQGDPVRPRGYEPGGNGRGEGLIPSMREGPRPGLCDRPTEPAVVPPGRGEGERQPTRGFLREAAWRLFGQDETQPGVGVTTGCGRELGPLRHRRAEIGHGSAWDCFFCRALYVASMVV